MGTTMPLKEVLVALYMRIVRKNAISQSMASARIGIRDGVAMLECYLTKFRAAIGQDQHGLQISGAATELRGPAFIGLRLGRQGFVAKRSFGARE